MTDILKFGRQLKRSAALGVEERGEHAGAVKSRPAQEIDRAVQIHQRDSFEIAHHTVMCYRFGRQMPCCSTWFTCRFHVSIPPRSRRCG
jgi:hypothetical protein